MSESLESYVKTLLDFMAKDKIQIRTSELRRFLPKEQFENEISKKLRENYQKMYDGMKLNGSGEKYAEKKLAEESFYIENDDNDTFFICSNSSDFKNKISPQGLDEIQLAGAVLSATTRARNNEESDSQKDNLDANKAFATAFLNAEIGEEYTNKSGLNKSVDKLIKQQNFKKGMWYQHVIPGTEEIVILSKETTEEDLCWLITGLSPYELTTYCEYIKEKYIFFGSDGEYLNAHYVNDNDACIKDPYRDPCEKIDFLIKVAKNALKQDREWISKNIISRPYDEKSFEKRIDKYKFYRKKLSDVSEFLRDYGIDCQRLLDDEIQKNYMIHTNQFIPGYRLREWTQKEESSSGSKKEMYRIALELMRIYEEKCWIGMGKAPLKNDTNYREEALNFVTSVAEEIVDKSQLFDLSRIMLHYAKFGPEFMTSVYKEYLKEDFTPEIELEIAEEKNSRQEAEMDELCNKKDLLKKQKAELKRKVVLFETVRSYYYNLHNRWAFKADYTDNLENPTITPDEAYEEFLKTTMTPVTMGNDGQTFAEGIKDCRSQHEEICTKKKKGRKDVEFTFCINGYNPSDNPDEECILYIAADGKNIGRAAEELIKRGQAAPEEQNLRFNLTCSTYSENPESIVYCGLKMRCKRDDLHKIISLYDEVKERDEQKYFKGKEQPFYQHIRQGLAVSEVEVGTNNNRKSPDRCISDALLSFNGINLANISFNAENFEELERHLKVVANDNGLYIAGCSEEHKFQRPPKRKKPSAYLLNFIKGINESEIPNIRGGSDKNGIGKTNEG